MDRVLIVSDEFVFANHLEKTLSQIGLGVSIHAQEFALLEAIDDKKPDIIIVKGSTAKVSTLKIGQFLKEAVKFDGKVILILNKDQKIDPTDINRVKMDYLLFEPVGAIKIVSHVLNLMIENRDSIRNRLLKMIDLDPQFKEKETLFLKSSGLSDLNQRLKEELFLVSGAKTKSTSGQEGAQFKLDSELSDVAAEAAEHFKNELIEAQKSIKAKIESYNSLIGRIDVDLQKSLKVRDTHKAQEKLNSEHQLDPGPEKLDTLDAERAKFAKAFFKK